MRVLVTGATGFLGGHIAAACRDTGHEVMATGRDINAAAVATFAPHVLIHTAWGGVAADGRGDVALQRDNVAITRRVFALYPFRQIIALGSQDEYGRYDAVIDETHPVAPLSPYGHAKVECCDMLRDLADERGDLEWQWLRVFSVYGPRQQPVWLIPSLIAACLSGQTTMAVTPGEQVYSYLYVDDLARAVASMVGCRGKNGIYNLSSAVAMPLRDIFGAVKTACGSAIVFDPSLPYRPGQTMMMVGDSGKFIEAFGPFETTPFAAGLKKTIDFYKTQKT